MYPDCSGLTAKTIESQVRTWGCSGELITGANRTAIGTGSQNTNDIVSKCRDSDFAAKLASDYSLEGYDDWLLPSRDELVACFSICSGDAFFLDQPSGTAILCSSSQNDGTTAIGRDYNPSLPINTFSKISGGTVFAIRDFE